MKASSRKWLLLAASMSLFIPACASQDCEHSFLTITWENLGLSGGDPDSSLATLAREIDHLERHIDKYGTIVTKTPAIWGESRLTKHRREFEEQMEAQVGKFVPTLNGYLARSDQAYLAQALSLSAAVSGQVAQGFDVKGQPVNSTTVGIIPAPTIVATNLVPGVAATPTAGAANPSAATAPATTAAQNTNVYQTQPFTNLPSTTPFNGFASSSLALEPTVLLDQQARYLNHLHELRRINEGDDTSVSPGYALYLVRVPVSVLPGKCTRTGHGAEITMSINSQYGEELLPKTYRNLVINDLIDLLGGPVFQYAKAIIDTKNTITSPTADMNKNGGGGAARTPDKNVVPVAAFQAAEKTPLQKLPTPATTLLPAYSTQPLLLRRIVSNSVSPSRVMAMKQKPHEPIVLDKTESDVVKKNTDEELQKRLDQALNRIAVSNGRQTRQALPPSQISPVLRECVKVLGEYAAKISAANPHSEDFDADLALDIHKLIAAELDGAYDLLSQNGSVESVWGTQTPKYLADAIRMNDAGHVEEMRFAFYQQIACKAQLSPVTSSLAWAVVVESGLLNERLNEDMKTVSTEKGCSCLPADAWLPFYGPSPPKEARQAFQQYVACRWPTHVFALDPVTQDENIGDTFSRRRETQLAISLAFASGKMSASSFTRYTRRLETDMATIALHRTALGFAHGPNHFGWRFYPRFQTPPIEGNLTVLTRDLILGGPTRDQDLRQTQLQPGMRECIALVIMPSFVSNITLDTRSNWFSLTHPKITSPSLKETMRLSASIQRMQSSAASLCDAHRYRPGDEGRLLRRVEQLSAELPLQTLHQQVPFENTLGGFAMFTSGMTDLAPQLYGYYGEPGVKLGAATEVVLVGNHFSVHETQVIAGNRKCQFQLLSRRVMRVTIPPDAQPLEPMEADQNKKNVDIHVLTPYGVSGHIHVPVVGGCPDAPNTKFSWSLPRMYSVNYTMTADAKKTVALPGNLLPATNELVIHAPDKMLFPGAAVLSLTLAEQDGGKIITAKDGYAVTYDFQNNRFVLYGTNFNTANGDLNKDLTTYLQNLAIAGTITNRTLTLTGRLVIAGNTFAVVDSNILISLKQQ